MACLRCGRKLTNSLSKKRGYGSTCYAKISGDKKKSNQLSKETNVIEQNFVDELRDRVS